MKTQETANDKLVDYFKNDSASWNRTRTDEELRNFIETRDTVLSESLLFD